MKTSSHYLISGLSVIALIGLIACGKTEEKKTASVPDAAVGTCPAGTTQTYVNGYMMCQGPNGYVTPIYQNYPFSNGQDYSSDNFCYNSLQITNSSQAQKFLREAMGVCDQNHSTGGNAACSAFTAGFMKINIVVSGNQMNFLMWAYPQNTGYWYSLPDFSDFFWGFLGFPVINTHSYATRNPLPLSMAVTPVNNSQGFQGQGHGDLYTLANRSLIQIQVAKGKPGDTHFDYGLAYEGVVFMTGTLVRADNYNYYCPQSMY